MRQPKQQAFAPLISLQTLSQNHTDLAKLMSLAGSCQSLDDLLNECLPELFRGQFKLNSFQNHTLTLTCHSAKLMTRFRFVESQVIQSLNTKLAPRRVATIKIKIRPQLDQRKAGKLPAPEQTRLSKKNAQILLEEAGHTEDKKLKEVLVRLSKHAGADA